MQVNFKESIEPILPGLTDVLMSTEPETSVRVNAAKGVLPTDGYERVAWCERGIYLPERPAFTFDPAMHQGLYYVQDASSMVYSRIASLLTADGAPVRWLDACAAPGGKTTAVLDRLPEGSFMLANEFDRKRVLALADNIERWGVTNTAVSNCDTSRLAKLKGFFDIATVDAPCSGEGMMRKETVAVEQWSPALVEQCAILQREIMANVWQAIRPGGYMVYSTCTFNRTENELNVEWAVRELGAESVDLGLTEFEGVMPAIDSEAHCARFIPGRVRGEGLFVSVLRKPGDGRHARLRPVKPTKSAQLPTWLDGDFSPVSKGDEVHAVPTCLRAEFAAVDAALNVVHQGVHVGTMKVRDLAPSYGLAHSNALSPKAFPTVEVDRSEAISYLRRQTPSPVSAPRGYVLLTHNGHPLGFIKNLGNRANSLMPAGCQIQSSHIPAPFAAIVK